MQEQATEKKAAVPNWGAVMNYVDEITTGVKDDDDPRFQPQPKKRKEPWDCFPKSIYKR